MSNMVVRVIGLVVLSTVLVVAFGTGTVSAIEWQIETASAYGDSTSMALDGADNPHIMFGGDMSSSVKHLEHTWNDGSGWQREIVALDGWYPSLEMDAAGQPHVSFASGPTTGMITYPDATPPVCLKYSWRDGSGWHTETVDSEEGETVIGFASSLALDSAGNPHISYWDVTNQYLKYAWRDASGWHRELLALTGTYSTSMFNTTTSLAVDSAGNPRVTFLDAVGNDLKYGRRDAAGWHFETVDSANAGGFSSLVLDDAGSPHISYLDYANQDLKYAWFAGGSWHTQTVDQGDAEQWVGWYTSLALDQFGRPHISYRSTDHGHSHFGLKFAWNHGEGWQTTVVGGWEDSWDMDSFHMTSLAMDSAGNPRIAHQGDVGSWNFTVRYAKGTFPFLQPDFTATPVIGTAPLTVQFTDQTTGGQPLSWSWDFGDGGHSVLTSPSHTYTEPGIYAVSLTVTNVVSGSRTRTKGHYIAVAQPLIVDFTASPRTGYAPLSVQFTDRTTGSPTGWTWYFGDGGTSTVQNPHHTYANPGAYRVTLVTSKGPGTNSTYRQNYIYVLPLTGPFTIQAEDYDEGGEGVAYHDTTATNEGGAYRSDGVDIEAFGRGYVVTRIWDGEWTRYTIPSAAAVNHDYNLTLRVATRTTGEQVRVKVDGFGEVVVDLPNTGSLTNYVDVPARITIGPGMNTVRFTFDGDYSNVDYFVLDPGKIDPIEIVQGGSGFPTDTNGDGKFDDVNGNGRPDFADVVLYFNQMSWIAANEPVPAFDCNGNSRIDFADVVWLFNHL